MSEQLSIVITASLSVFAVVGVGVLVRRLGVLTEEADKSLLNLIVNVLLPCLIFSVVVESQTLRQGRNLIWPPLVGYATMVGGCLTALATARWFGLKPGPPRRTFAFSVGLYNYGYIPIPLVMALFGSDTLAVLFVHNLGVELGTWTVGIALLTGRGGWRRVINAPAVAIIVAVAANLAGARPYLPDFVMSATNMIGAATIPLGLLLVGATVADHVKVGQGLWRTAATAKIIAGAMSLRLLVLPALFLFVAMAAPVSLELKQVMAVQIAMPAAIITVVLAKHFGGDPSVALRVALATSLAGLITIPLWLALSMRVLGL
jgi:predicted permease